MRTKIFLMLTTILLFSAVSGNSQSRALGKFYITVTVDADGFEPSGARDSVKDMHNRIGRDRELELAETEDEADFMITIINREEAVVSGQSNSRSLSSTLMVRDDEGNWKAGTKITKTNSGFWNIAAIDTLNEAKKWIKDQAKNK
jgi:hypothetical protein